MARNAGIFEAIRKGPVTSVSILANGLRGAGKRRAATWPGPQDEADGLIRAYAFARKPS